MRRIIQFVTVLSLTVIFFVSSSGIASAAPRPIVVVSVESNFEPAFNLATSFNEYGVEEDY